MTRRGKLSAHDKQWKLRTPAPQEFVDQLGRGEMVATLLYQRGQNNLHEAVQFLDNTYPDGLHDPLLMKGMDEAGRRVAQAIATQEPIVVYGDYDADGVTAATLLKQAIITMGGNVSHRIPDRFKDGYGLNERAVADLAAQGSTLLITVDCGISNASEVHQAHALGMDVIVTDHHTPPETLPACTILNPKQPGCPYPYKQLVGVGIAFKLVRALYTYGLRSTLRGRDMLELVALGTVADIAPLNGENRILVKAGLQAINQTERPGLQALIKAAGLVLGQVDSMGIGYRLAPRINAAGRIDHADLAHTLLLTDDAVLAQQLAQELNKKNQERQQATEEVQQTARQQAHITGKLNQRIVILDDETYHEGIVGLVAGKLVEEWWRPVVLLKRETDLAHGSARSIPGFNIIEALTYCANKHPNLFERFGGHSMAAGLTIKTDNLNMLEACLLEQASTNITDAMLIPSLDIDAEINLEDIQWELYKEISQLAPFGERNPQPVLLSRNVEAADVREIGPKGQHLKLRLRKNGDTPLEAIAWRLGHLAAPLQKHPFIDIAYTIEDHEWNGYKSLQLNIKDFRRVSKNVLQRG